MRRQNVCMVHTHKFNFLKKIIPSMTDWFIYMKGTVIERGGKRELPSAG